MNTSSLPLTLNNIIIESRSSDNFINATQLCKAGGKYFTHWYHLQTTTELIREFTAQNLKHGIPCSAPPTDIKHGGRNAGAWIHPDLAVQLAQWISPIFALKVSQWIRELMLTGSVTLGQEHTPSELDALQRQLTETQSELEATKKALDDAEFRNARKDESIVELIEYKKLNSRDETVYIVSTLQYARKGVYKIGRTKNMDQRLRTLNTGHMRGDKVHVLCTFKVNDSTLVERVIHRKLAGLLLKGTKEMFQCPFDLLEDMVNMVVNGDVEQNELVDKIVNMVHGLRESRSEIDWMSGLDPNTFTEKWQLTDTATSNNLLEMDVTMLSDEDKKKLVERCLREYVKIQTESRHGVEVTDDALDLMQVIWKSFQPFLISKLSIPKNKFRSHDWKQPVKDAAETVQMKIKWRGSE